jgi:hypothetical protein
VVQHKSYDGGVTSFAEGSAMISQGSDGFPGAFEVMPSSKYGVGGASIA